MASAAPSTRPRQQTPADRIDAAADRINRLTVTRSDPEAFFAERSDISGELRRIARHMRGGR